MYKLIIRKVRKQMTYSVRHLGLSKQLPVATIAYWSAIENMNSDRTPGFCGVRVQEGWDGY